jgi:chloramphenicol O-acetyltransferase type A
MAYKVIDKESYYRRDVFRRFSEDCKCSLSMTARVDVTELAAWSKRTGTKFYLNFLYLLSRVLNSREDYRMDYYYRTGEMVCYDVIHPTHYAFHPDTETCTPVYSTYYEDYATFYAHAAEDLAWAKENPVYIREATKEQNRFDASFIPWLSYDALHMELPDGYLYFAPIVNWGAYREEGGRLMMPVTVRMNHAVADGYLVALVFRLLAQEIETFIHDHREG